MAGSHSEKMSWTEPQSRGGGAVVLGIVNGRRRHSPDRSVRFGLVTSESARAKGSSIAFNPPDWMGFQRVGRGPTDAR